MRSILAGEATVGTKMRAGTPSLIAANATAAPWLPPEAATTPAGGTGRQRRLVNAPRALNEPACCSDSSLKTTLVESSPTSAPRTSMTGVHRM